MTSSAAILSEYLKGRTDMRTFTERVMEQCGGIDGFANMLMEDYRALEPGNRTRVAIAKMIVELLRYEAEYAPPSEELTIEDIEQELARLTTRGTVSVGGPAGCPEEPEAA